MKIINRKEAIGQGLTHYFTGKPCTRGHIAPRFVSIRKCKECSKEDAMKKHVHTTEKRRSYNDLKSFVKKALKTHNNFYSYTKALYTNAHTPLSIECPIHGEFFQSPTNHISSGKGCPTCGSLRRTGKLRKDTEQFVIDATKIWGSKWSYTNTVYVKAKKQVIITCFEHGDFLQTPTNHLSNKEGCPKCNHTKSKEEDRIQQFMSIFTPTIQRDRTIIGPKELDIYLPEHNLAIEYCGMYWHSHGTPEDEKRNKHKHYTKYKQALDKGVRVLTIYESEWVEREFAIKRILRSAVGKMKGKLMARKCELRLTTNSSARTFFDKYHPQGGAGHGVNYALFWKGKMVACMRFAKGINDRGNGAKSAMWTLSRYATRITVAGGASRLFKQFLKDNDYPDVKSFSDNRWFSGGMYQKLGFRLEQESIPDYQVWSAKVGLKPKSHYQRRALPDRIKEHEIDIAFDPTTDPRTEQTMTYALGARRIYDCGKKKWVFSLT